MSAINLQDPQVLNTMCGVLAGCFDGYNKDLRANSEREIKRIQDLVDVQQGYLQLLLMVAGTESVELATRQSAATTLKNMIKNCWFNGQSEHVVQEAEKQAIRHQIFSVMLAAPTATVALLGECIQLIGSVDFPKVWPDLLHAIVATLSAPNVTLQAMHISLKTASSLFQKYRNESELTAAIADELLFINGHFTAPLLKTLQFLTYQLKTNQDPAILLNVVKALKAAVSCYNDLTTMDMGQEHEDNLPSLMTAFRECLQYRHPQLMGTMYEAGELILLHATILECLRCHLQQFSDEFQPYVETFTNDVWELINSAEGKQPAADDLIITALEYLSAVGRSGHKMLLVQGDRLRVLCEQVIIPNLHLRENVEVEMFEEEEEQYVAREIEGSDVHTRRRAALELVRSLIFNFDTLVTPVLQNCCMALLSQGWLAKDAAIYLITAMAVRGTNTSSREASELNPTVPVGDFYAAHILPEITNAAPKSHAILKADAIRFVATFRSFLGTDNLGNLLVHLAPWLAHESQVVHTYAAHAIDKLLQVRTGGKMEPDVTADIFAASSDVIVQNLCTRLLSSAKPNEYCMKALFTVMRLQPVHTKRLIGPLMYSLSQVLGAQVKNPSNPVFNHCLWECIAFGIKYAPEHYGSIEPLFFPHIAQISRDEVAAFLPYMLQIIAQLIDARAKQGVTDFGPYLDMYPEFVKPSLFELKGNIPAVAKLLASYNRACPQALEQRGMTLKTLGVYQQLLSLKQFDHEGFNVLAAMVLHCPPEIIDKHMPTVLQIMFNRQQSSPTPKFSRCEVYMFSVIAAHRGGQYFSALADSIQPGLTALLLQRVWLKHITKIQGVTERKVAAVGLIRVATEVPAVIANAALLQETLVTVLKLIHAQADADDHLSFAPTHAGIENLSAMTDFDEASFTNQYCPLQAAAFPPEDAARFAQDANSYLQQQCAAVIAGPNAAGFRAGLAMIPAQLRSYITVQ
jgi:exportin-2 (importin alpha re-exporter)